ncbi:serine/threonine-protein kinase [Streptomyces hundungensis]|uniref:serine/threonine-protein kinase n=1 Tax=Streptomyces hundungensis TaxID=1077946 RepID=UPI0033DF68F9
MDTLRPSQDPERIGTYALLARLGAGGMGMVYLGRSPGGRLVAIKVIKDEITDHPEALTRFRREAETVRAVRGAYTANLIDASLSAPPYWLATEYVAGPTLSHAVRERGAFPADTCLRLFAALAEGLASVHGYGVTHRDLKPQNVILSPQGPQLIDFGIAKGAEDTALTRTGLAPGTPGFTAPEVLMRNQVGAAADVFALGATIAFAATGRAPFGGGPMDAVSYRAVHEEIDVVGVEPRLAALIRACAAKDPAERPRPAEIIALCAVGSVLSEDPHYLALGSLGEEVPETAMRGPHDMPTAGPGYVPTRSPSQAGYVPTLAPHGETARTAPRSRRTPWIVTLAVVTVLGVTVGVTVWKGRLGSGSGAEADAKAPSAQGTPGPSAQPSKGGGAQKPPEYIENNRVSRDYWTLSKDPGEASHGVGQCRTIGGESNMPGEFQTGVNDAGDESRPDVAGKARISMRIKYAELLQQQPEPYYISVGVKPAHEIDPDTGKPFDGLLMESKGVGYTSKPVNIYAKWKSGEFFDLTYPDDFVEHVDGKTYPPIPVRNDPGDWTVVFYHVKGSPTDYSSVGCSGFRVN